jgi:hypothetical protein
MILRSAFAGKFSDASNKRRVSRKAGGLGAHRDSDDAVTWVCPNQTSPINSVLSVLSNHSNGSTILSRQASKGETGSTVSWVSVSDVSIVSALSAVSDGSTVVVDVSIDFSSEVQAMSVVRVMRLEKWDMVAPYKRKNTAMD